MIRIHAVNKRFKDTHAVRGLSIEIRKGEFVALLGPNGAGKTTLVEMIEGIQTQDDGQIEIDGKNWDAHKQELRLIVGLAFQETKLIDKLTVFETLSLFASFHGLPMIRCEEILTQIGLPHKRDAEVTKLSGGQKQKVVLGLALLHRPQLLILDEPTTGLDPVSRREVWDLLKELKAQDVTLILTTHYMEEAEVLCDRIVMMNEGQIIADGTFQQLVNALGSFELIIYRTQHPITQGLDQLPGFISHEAGTDGNYVLKVSSLVEALPEFVRIAQHTQNPILELDCRRTTLDDLFLSLTGRGLND